VPCVVTQVDAASGSLMIDVKPGLWITVQQQITCMRALRGPVPTARAAPMDTRRGPSAPPTAVSSERLLLALHPDLNSPTPPQAVSSPTPHRNFSVGQHCEYCSRSLNAWIPCVVTHVNQSTGAVMLNVKPGQWLSAEEQAGCLRSTRPGAVPSAVSNAPTQGPAYHDPNPNMVATGEMLNADFWAGVLVQPETSTGRPASSSEPLSAAMPRAQAAPMGSRTEGLQPRALPSAGYPFQNGALPSAGYPSQNGPGLPSQPRPQNVQSPPNSSGSSLISPPPISRSPSVSWGVEDVVQYLQSIELGHLANTFRENGVDGLMLQELSEEDLMTELGCTKLQARKIRQRNV